MLTRMGLAGNDDGRSFDRNRRGGRFGSDRDGYGYGRRDSLGDRFSGGRDGRDGRDGMERRSSGVRPWERDEGRGGRSRDREWEDRRGRDDGRGERRAREW